ncbi:MAG: hypothetical protein JKY02_09010, partial [Flavobacteriaceae bacterium]|nr:hypothetical protein [Flavobacteriaceae bacterium]
MKRTSLLLALFISITVVGQTINQDSINNPQNQQNAAQRILSGNIKSGVTVGGYGEITYNNPTGKTTELDVQRLVLLFGYKFDDRTQFITEVELEHVNEVFVEQAFLQYAVTDNFNFRAGLMLVPMGIVNEYHEPTTFNGVERPSMDNAIIPTTWREIGFGVTGKFDDASLRYQAYIFNGFKSVESDGNGVITNGLIGGSKGLRGGRQKGIKSTFNNANIATKLDYYGLPGLRLGVSGYFGRTQSPEDVQDLSGADVGISMFGFDARYAKKRFTARGQFVYANLSDTDSYNTATGSSLGSALQGYYVEAAYNLIPLGRRQQLFGFVRYEDYDTHASVDGALTRNDAYNKEEWTFGLSYKIAPGAVVKADYQIKNNAAAGSTATKQLNFGIGV